MDKEEKLDEKSSERSPEEIQEAFKRLLESLQNLKEIEDEFVETTGKASDTVENITAKFGAYLEKLFVRLDKLIPKDVKGEDRTEATTKLVEKFFGKDSNLQKMFDKFSDIVMKELVKNKELLDRVVDKGSAVSDKLSGDEKGSKDKEEEPDKTSEEMVTHLENIDYNIRDLPNRIDKLAEKRDNTKAKLEEKADKERARLEAKLENEKAKLEAKAEKERIKLEEKAEKEREKEEKARAKLEAKEEKEKAKVEAKEDKGDKPIRGDSKEIVKWLQKINDSIQNSKGGIGGGGSSIGNIGSRLMAPLKSGINMLLAPFDAIKNAFNKITSTILAIPKKMFEWGKNRVKRALGTGGVSSDEYYAKGVKYFERTTRLLEKIAGLEEKKDQKEKSEEVKEGGPKKEDGKKGSSVESKGKREDLAEAIANGIIKTFTKLFEAGGAIIGVILAGLSGWKLGEWINDNWGKEIQDGIQKIADFFSGLVDDTSKFFSDTWTQYVMDPIRLGMASVSDWWTNSVTNPIQEALVSISNWVNDKLVNPFKSFFNMIADSWLGKKLGLEKTEMSNTNQKANTTQANSAGAEQKNQDIIAKINNGEKLSKDEYETSKQLLKDGRITNDQFMAGRNSMGGTSSTEPEPVTQETSKSGHKLRKNINQALEDSLNEPEPVTQETSKSGHKLRKNVDQAFAGSLSDSTEPKQNTSADAITLQTKAANQAQEQKGVEMQKAMMGVLGSTMNNAQNNVQNVTNQTFMRIEPRNNDNSYNAFIGLRTKFDGLAI